MAATSKKGKTKEVRGTPIDVVRELLGDHQAADAVLDVVAKLAKRNEELEKLIASVRPKNGANERVSHEQLELFLQKLQAASEGELKEADAALEKTATSNGGRAEPNKPRPQPPLRRPIPPGLRRIENPIPLPESERPCPNCGTARKCVYHERSEVIDFKPAEVIVRVDIREVVACASCDSHFQRAPMGDKVVASGAYGASLVAKLLVGKFDLGMPLHRQAEELSRLGLDMPSSSMSDQMTWATDLLTRIWVVLCRDVLNSYVMHIDGTSLPVLDRDHPNGITTGALWGCVGDNAAAFLYTSTGKKDKQRPGEIGPADFLLQRKGPVCADASSIFDSSFACEALVEIGCNMHARRYFAKALDANDARAAVPIAAFRALYDIEDRVRDASPEQRLAERQQHAKPVYDELLKWCRTYQPTEPPTSLLGRAIQYLINHHIALRRYLEDGRLPIDNGIVERAHRRPAIGRRNYLFAGSHAAGKRVAIAYSILATCRLVDVDPMQYLTDVLPRLAREALTMEQCALLTPMAWKLARSS